MKRFFLPMLALVALTAFSQSAFAAPDCYKGDTAIYGSPTSSLRPKVLFLIDNSHATLNPAVGEPYNPAKIYTGGTTTFRPNSVYLSDNQGIFNSEVLTDYSVNLQCSSVKTILGRAGIYAGSGTVDNPNIDVIAGKGVCQTSHPTGAVYARGNYLNYLETPIDPRLYVNVNGSDYLLALSHEPISCMSEPYDCNEPGNELAIDYEGERTYECLVTNDDGTTTTGTCTETVSIPALDSTPEDRATLTPVYRWAAFWTKQSTNTSTNSWSAGGNSGPVYPPWYATPNPGKTQREIVYKALELVIQAVRGKIDIGAMVYSSNNVGGELLAEVSDLSSEATYTAFLAKLPGNVADKVEARALTSRTARPQAGALYDAGLYFQGNYGNSGLMIGSDRTTHPSPIQYKCDSSEIIMITNGMSNGDQSPKLKNNIKDFDDDMYGGDAPPYDGEGEEIPYGQGSHYLDDVAKYLYDKDNIALPGEDILQRVKTHTVLVFQPEDSLVSRASDSAHGNGNFYNVYSAEALARALADLFQSIVDDTDTSFIAPVVPVSPENRTYSGSRVYMGFFKPQDNKYWKGNLKKYGLDENNNIVDSRIDADGKHTFFANYIDKDNNGFDDRGNNTNEDPLANKSRDGSFRPGAKSFWSSDDDGASVVLGGVGGVLKDTSKTVIDPTGADPLSRKIYTNLNGAGYLITTSTTTGNIFTTTNTSITPDMFRLTTVEAKDKLIGFFHGVNAYGEKEGTETTPPANRNWVLGDILHSKPVIVNYQSYTQTEENDCSKNTGIVYVGSNDGMLHAFRDCDGTEAWAFIPNDLLPQLRFITTRNHNMFADSTVSEYVFDNNMNGTIETDAANGDKAVIVFGLRRGSGQLGLEGRGFYYALDVTDPEKPRVLWGRIGNNTAGFDEMGESWSEPKIVKMKIGTYERIVAIFGGGYDNCNEDSRYGGSQFFNGVCANLATPLGAGMSYSPGAAVPITPSGRALYFVQIAILDSDGKPAITENVTQLKRFVPVSTTTNTTIETVVPLQFSLMSEVAPIDSDSDGNVDRVYVGDAGGNLWRFNVGDTNRVNWSAVKLFSSHAGFKASGDPMTNVADFESNGRRSTGRKIFYRPAVTMEVGGSAIVFFGTGDREHPLNQAHTDRIYAIKDTGGTTTLTESHLVDVTDDKLQGDDAEAAALTVSALSAKKGWYIRLNQHAGEKVLALPTLFSKAIYFTTFTPNAVMNLDPCEPGNLGMGRLYALNYKTGEAVIDQDGTPGLSGSDRSTELGAGIPSGVVVVVSQTGDVLALIGSGGTITTEKIKATGGILPIYWRQK